MLEITMLGTWIVVLSIVSIAGLFLWLTRHRYSAVLLLVATAGGIGLNNILKVGFSRPRPHIFEWGTHVEQLVLPVGARDERDRRVRDGCVPRGAVTEEAHRATRDAR